MEVVRIQFMIAFCFFVIDAADPHSHFEGDINIAGLDMNMIGHKEVVQLKSALTDPALIEKSRWKDGIVPYKVSEVFAGRHQRMIKKAMEDFRRRTCVRFVERTGEKDYLYITPGLFECNSFVGKTGGIQYVYFRMPDCERRGKIQHELMHALGFFHEQSRMDRDNYIEVNWGNIEKENQNNFEKYVDVKIHEFGQPYDFSSIMHYGSKDFAIDQSSYAIQARAPYEEKEIGQRRQMSDLDVVKINLMYKCGNITVTSTVKSTQPTTTPTTVVPTSGREAPGPDPSTPKPAAKTACKSSFDTSCSKTQEFILNLVNVIRRKLPAANMLKVQWDDALSSLAQNQADECTEQKPKHADWSGWKVAVAAANWNETIDGWLGPQDRLSSTCGGSGSPTSLPLIVWGKYTRMSSDINIFPNAEIERIKALMSVAKINKIGCGYSTCRGNFFYCFFGPRINKKQLIFGPERCTPYLPRSPKDGVCGQCGGPQSDQCDDGLCLSLFPEKR